MQSSPTVVMRPGGRGRRAATGTVLVAALLGLAGVLMSSSAYAAEAKAKPKVKAKVVNKVLIVSGTSRSETIALRLRAGYPGRLQVDAGNNRSAEYTFRRSRFNRIVVFAGAGNDRVLIDESKGVFTTTEATSLYGDAGKDELRGGSGSERFFGGGNADRVDGNKGRDRASLGAGDDSFRWDPGDGNDTVEGNSGTDLLVFNTSAGAETFELSPNGGRARFLRNVGNVVMDLGSTERVDLDLRADGQADVVGVKGSAADDVLRIAGRFDVAGSAAALRVSRADAGDRLNVDPRAGSDRVTVAGSEAADNISIAPAAAPGHVTVSGGIDLVATESLVVESLGGNDVISGANGLAALTKLTLDGGSGADQLGGGDGDEVIIGGSENDAVDGNRGNDTALLGAGDDSFTWDPGDGSDKVEGEAGTDALIFNGAAAAESFDFSANGNRLRLFRDVASITMDVDDTERVDLRALGGIDNSVVNDLSATDVKDVELELSADGAADTITVNGSGGNDTIAIAANAGAVDVTGLAAAVKIEQSEAANDLLNVNGLGGNDTISGSVGLAALIKVAIDGGAGNDTINGGDGAETLTGGDGNDAIDGNRGDDTGLLGAGDDSFRWDPGDGSDVVEGQAGTDTLVFNGAGAAENFDVSANGERVKFFRDVASITMDLNDTERIDTQALGGADNAVVNDVTGTDLKLVAFDLETAIGGGAGDGAADSVTVNGTNLADDIDVTAIGSVVDVDGSPAEVQIDHSEAANDKLTVNGLAGADTITGGPGLAALIQLVINGGTEVDVLTGGDGNDRIVGQQQNDSMLGGAGNDTLVWNPGDGNDLVEGQAGNDTMEFNGAAGAEAFDASAVAGRLRFTRNVGNIVMDVGGTERVDLRMLGGADTAVVNDLTGTDVTEADIDLAAAIGGTTGDGAADAITVNGTNGADNVAIAANGGVVDVTGLFTSVGISHSEVANDTLAINTLGGNDDVAVGGGVAGLIQTLVDLGSGE